MFNIDQMRAAKGILDWSFDALSEKTGMSTVALQNIYSGKTKPHANNAEKIKAVFEKAGIEFVNGGARRKQSFYTVLEGDDCYIRLLDHALTNHTGEVLFSDVDDARSPQTVTDRLRTLHQNGVSLRFLAKHGDTNIQGSLDMYRCMPTGLFVEGDVKVTYGNYSAYFMSYLDVPRVLLINNKHIADENRRTFNFIWDHSDIPSHSTAEVRFA